MTTEREKFEAWSIEKFGWRREDDEYTSAAWDGWQAALAVHEAPEPVAWMNKEGTGAVFRNEETSTPSWIDYYYIPLYTRGTK